MQKVKRCFKCKQCKPYSEFYKHSQTADGLLGKCKVCAKQDMKKARDENIEDHRRRDRARYYGSEVRRKQTAASAAKATPEKRVEYNRRYRKKYPARFRAHSAVNYALQKGKLVRQPCEICGATKSEAHHDDYSKPLEVRWLCRTCHGLAHRKGA